MIRFFALAGALITTGWFVHALVVVDSSDWIELGFSGLFFFIILACVIFPLYYYGFGNGKKKD